MEELQVGCVCGNRLWLVGVMAVCMGCWAALAGGAANNGERWGMFCGGGAIQALAWFEAGAGVDADPDAGAGAGV